MDLGLLESVAIREIWAGEATHFTPWLAKEDNLGLLSKALGIELELEAQEKSVGPFRADILCKEVSTDRWVLIENQLERTDHTHLGQLATYASGLNAAIIIWIAAKFTDEHRATLDWLNHITNDEFKFFGIEIEAWRIGSSKVAPRFNIVSKPNDWSKHVASAAKALDVSDLSETRQRQLKYWDRFHQVLNEHQGPVSGNRKAQPQSWMSYSVGTSRFNIGAAMERTKRRVRAELYISGEYAKAWFEELKDERQLIEDELKCELDWQFLPEGTDCRIALYLENIDPDDETNWPHQHRWLAEKVNDFHRVFSDRVKKIS